MLLALMVVIGIVANPNTVAQKIGHFEWLPINLYINGDTFYYVLYGMLGRALGMMDTQKKSLTVLSATVFVVAAFAISRGTLHELKWRGNFADTWYVYCGPLVFICAMSLFTLVKNTLSARALPGWRSSPATRWESMVFMPLSFMRCAPVALKFRPGQCSISCGFLPQRCSSAWACRCCCSVLIRGAM
jgi:hypothetical protein